VGTGKVSLANQNRGEDTLSHQFFQLVRLDYQGMTIQKENESDWQERKVLSADTLKAKGGSSREPKNVMKFKYVNQV